MRKSMQTSAIGLALVLALLVFSPGLSHAVPIVSFQPGSQTVDLFDQATVDLVISGLGDFSPDSLGTFDVDIGFDASILQLDTVTFGTQLDITMLGSIQGVGIDNTAGIVDIFELSLDFYGELDILQPGEFVLASLTFDTIGVGTSGLNLLNHPVTGDPLIGPVFGDSLGFPLDVDLTDGSITVVRDGTQPIPEPGTIFLLGSGLLGIAGLRRKLS